MCRSIVRRYFAPGLDREDLLQEARIGAWKGLRDFNPSRGSLSSFVWLAIERNVQTAVKTSTRGKHGPLNDAVSLATPIGADDTDGTLADVLPSRVSVDELVAQREELRGGLTDLGHLTDLERVAVVGHAVGCSYDEIAEAATRTVRRDRPVSRKNVDNALQRGRRSLEQRRHRRRGDEHSEPPPRRTVARAEPEGGPMSRILDAIDEEIEGVKSRRDELAAEVEDLEQRIAKLGTLREGAAELNGDAPTVEVEVTADTSQLREAADEASAALERASAPPKRRRRSQDPPPVTDEERQQRAKAGDEAQARVFEFIREHGSIDHKQCAELLGITVTTAANKLRTMCTTTGLNAYDGERPEGVTRGRPPRVYRLTAATRGSSGGRTATESKIIDVVAEDGPIDETTLAARAEVKPSSARTILRDLVSRQMLRRSDVEGVTLYEAAA